MINVITKCPFCGKESSILVRDEDFEAWQNGALIQDVMEYLDSSERERLISGICSDCWNKMFGEEEDYEPEKSDYDFADTYIDIGFNPYMGCYDEDC